MAQHTITIPITKNGYISRRNPSTHYSVSDYLLSGISYKVGMAVLKDYKAVLGFDDNSYPKRKKILSSTLHYYLVDTVYQESPHTNTEVITSITNRWNESTITYNNCLKSNEIYTKHHYSNISSGWKQVTFNNVNYENGIVLDVGSPFNDGSHRIYSRNSSYAPYIRVTYEDIPPEAPTLLNPNGKYIDNTSIVRFQWVYNSSVGGVQKGFELQWSNNNGVSWTAVTRTTSNNYYDMPANTLSTGNILWRIRTKNEYDEFSNYSKVFTFYSVGMPTPPVMNVPFTDTSRPTVSWTANDQQIFQLQVFDQDLVVHDSGITPSTTINNYKIPVFLDDGDYIVKLKTKNRYDLWSDWAEKAITITTVKPYKPTIEIISNSFSIDIKTVKNDNCILYRKKHSAGEFIPINKTTSGRVTDNTLENNTVYEYFIRVVVNDKFNDSDIVSGVCHFKNSILNVNDNIIELKYSLQKNNKDFSFACDSVQNNYSGRTYPVTEYSGFQNKIYGMSFFVSSKEEIDSFVDFINKRQIILFRDKYTKEYGNISSVKIKQYRKGFSLDFTFSVTDYSEEIEV